MPGQGTRYDDRGNVVLVHQPGTAAPIYAQNAQGLFFKRFELHLESYEIFCALT